VLINVYATCRALPAPNFPLTVAAQRDRSDPALLPHLHGFMGFVMDGGKRPMTTTRYAVLRHLERVQHHLSLEVEDEHLEAFSAWALECNAITFLPDSSVRAPEGTVLVEAATGDADPTALVPYPPDALARKSRTDVALAQHGVQVPAGLPPVIAEVEVALRAPREVAERCLALLLCALRAESLASENAIPVAELRAKMPLAWAATTPVERAFLESEAPSRQEIVDHVWRYESLALLAWAVRVTAELPLPTAVCDVPGLARAMFELDAEAFVRDARLRDVGVLLDALDLHFRLHWATTDARLKKAPPPAGLEPGVVHERHHALNWLVRFEDAEWDEVATPT